MRWKYCLLVVLPAQAHESRALHCVNVSGRHLWRGPRMAPNKSWSLPLFNCYFLCCLPWCPRATQILVEIHQLINRENKQMKYTRAKKLVWQSSKLAPLVCEFGWAICVYGGKSGREVYARSHTHGTIHTHTHTERRVYDVELWMQLYTFFTQSNGLFPSSMSIIMACNVFTLWNASHTHTHQSCRGTHTQTQTSSSRAPLSLSLTLGSRWNRTTH